jgi:hypothetical protein
MIFDTKVAILVLEDLAVWQKLNMTAFLATGIAGAAPEAMGEPYEDAAGRRYARLVGQPILIFAATAETLLRAYRAGLDRGLSQAVYVRAMFSTGHDAANRAAFKAQLRTPATSSAWPCAARRRMSIGRPKVRRYIRSPRRGSPRLRCRRRKSWKSVVLLEGIELSTSPLPRECSTTELQQRNRHFAGGF